MDSDLGSTAAASEWHPNVACPPSRTPSPLSPRTCFPTELPVHESLSQVLSWVGVVPGYDSQGMQGRNGASLPL